MRTKSILLGDEPSTRDLTRDRDRLGERLNELEGKEEPSSEERAELLRASARFDELTAEIDRLTDAEIAGWKARRADPNFYDGDHAGAYANSPHPGIVGYTVEGSPVRILRPDEPLCDPATARQGQGALGAWVKAQVTGDWSDYRRFAATEQTGYTQADGGVLLESGGRVLDLARSRARVVEAGAFTVPMPTRELTIARVVSAPSGSYRGENKNILVGKLQFDGVKLAARTRAVIATAPNELMEDAPNFGRVIEENLAAELALELDRVALFGTGAAEEPLGLENTDDVGTQTAVGIPVNFDPFSDAVRSVWDANGEPNAVIFSPRTANTLDKLKDTTNQPLRPPASYDALAKLPTTQVPNDRGAGSDESLGFLGDFEQLWIGVRKDIRIELSRHAGFDKNQTYIRALMRIDVVAVRPDHFVVLSGITA